MKLLLLLALLVLGLSPLFSGCSTLDETSADHRNMTDADIRHDVLDRLRRDEITTRTTFGVTVDGGVLTLTGVVSGPNVKARAVSIAQGAPGVTDVVDNLSRF